MNNAKDILIGDFNLFHDLMKSVVKIVDSAKIQISETGLAIYGAKKPFARCEFLTNALTSTEPFDFCILDLQMFTRILSTIREVHEDDYSTLKIFLQAEKLCFQSKKFKTKIQTQKETIIEKWLSTKIQTKLTPIFQFTTTNNLIKRIKNHQFIFTDPTMMRVYLETKTDMENNTLYATIGNKQLVLNNEMTLKFGLVTYGSLGDKSVILDVDRINLFDAVPSDEIKISLMDANVLVSDVTTKGKNDTYFNVKVYSSLLKQ